MAQHFTYSAPGRTEISGNHTDHQHGCVLAAAVNLETIADVDPVSENTITVFSEGYPSFSIDLDDLQVRPEEKNTTIALVRGVAAGFARRGAKLHGFQMRAHSSVLPGSGLSSSAAFEVLVGTIINDLFCDGKFTPVEIAQIAQYAENVYFGKPCGLMDQMASSVGGLVSIDFADPAEPVVERIDFDFAATNHALCIIDSGADHADLTDEYGAIPGELAQICQWFGKKTLRQVPQKDFLDAIPDLRGSIPDRAILRAIHVYQENERVRKQVQALKDNDFSTFLRLVTESGKSSWTYLQNIYPAGETDLQPVAVALAMCDTFLQSKGAYRVHGGGFAGTVQAFVPLDMLEDFKQNIEAVLGMDSCHVLSIRSEGGIRLK